MKNIAKRLIKNQKGQALILALILLLVGGLICASLLAYMGTGFLTGEVYEVRTAELYAADAGVEDAMWRIPDLGLCVGQSTNYTIPDVNGKSVKVTIEYVSDGTYRITSIAITNDGGGTAAIDSGTAVEAYATSVSGNYSGIMDHVLTSQGQFYCPKNQLCICDDLVNLVEPGCGDENGPEPNYNGTWPDTPGELERFADFYWQQVKNETHYTSPIDLHGNNMTLDGRYLDNTAIITNSEQGEESAPVLKLDGTLYITGNAQINPTQEMILDLNRQTIFVESSSIKSVDGQYALSIGAGGGGDNTKLKIIGPGIIIAIGDIYFAPGEQLGGEDYPIFIFSISGKAELQPGGTFYGAVAASVRAELKSNNMIDYPEGGFGGYGLNFPGLSEVQPVYSIASWEATPLSLEDFGE